MRPALIFTTVTVFLTSAIAGTYHVDNYCSFPMYLESTSTPTDGSPVPLVILAANTLNTYSEIFRDAAYSINALTLSRTPDMMSPIQATYHQTTDDPSGDGLNFYALSTIFGDPLMAEGFQLLTDPDGFGLNCPPRSPGQACPYTYAPSNPNGVQAVYCQDNSEDLRLTLCQYNQNVTADSG